MEKNRRKRTRVDFTTKVVLKTESDLITVNADSADISLKGIFIKTEDKIIPGTRCDIEILLSGTSSRLSLNIKGVIVHQRKDGLGVNFESMDVDSHFHLKNIVMYNADDPDEIEKEMLE